MCKNINSYHWQSTWHDATSILVSNNVMWMLHTTWNNSTIMLTSWSGVVQHLERIRVPCARCLNRRASTPLPPMKRNYNRCEPRLVNGTLPWHSSWVLTAHILDNSWKHMKMTSHKVWIGTHTPGQMHSTSWLTTRKMSATTFRSSSPTMVWHSPHVMKSTITMIRMRMMCPTSTTQQHPT